MTTLELVLDITEAPDAEKVVPVKECPVCRCLVRETSIHAHEAFHRQNARP